MKTGTKQKKCRFSEVKPTEMYKLLKKRKELGITGKKLLVVGLNKYQEVDYLKENEGEK